MKSVITVKSLINLNARHNILGEVIRVKDGLRTVNVSTTKSFKSKQRKYTNKKRLGD